MEVVGRDLKSLSADIGGAAFAMATTVLFTQADETMMHFGVISVQRVSGYDVFTCLWLTPKSYWLRSLRALVLACPLIYILWLGATYKMSWFGLG